MFLISSQAFKALSTLVLHLKGKVNRKRNVTQFGQLCHSVFPIDMDKKGEPIDTLSSFPNMKDFRVVWAVERPVYLLIDTARIILGKASHPDPETEDSFILYTYWLKRTNFGSVKRLWVVKVVGKTMFRPETTLLTPECVKKNFVPNFVHPEPWPGPPTYR